MFTHLEIRIDDINLNDQRFRMTNSAVTPELERSMRNLGILNSPLVLKRGKELYLISGFRRLDVLRKLGVDRVHIRLTDTEDDFFCARMAIADNAIQRPLNNAEQIRAIRILKQNSEKGMTFEAMFPILCETLQITENKAYAQKLWDAETLLSDDLVYLIENDRINLDAALALGMLEHDGQVKAGSIFARFKISLNKQNEFVHYVREISARENSSICEILDDTERLIQKFDKTSDKNVVFASVREYLKKRRYPTMTQFEKEREELISKLRIPKGMTLKLPEYFEGSMNHITLNFKTLRDFKILIEKLEDISLKPEMKRLISKDFKCNNFEMH